MTPWFPPLVASRLVAGVAMGLLTWIAWADSAANGKRRGEVAAIGPLAAAVSAPAVGVVTDVGGTGWLFAFLGALGAVAMLVPPDVEVPVPDQGRRQRPNRPPTLGAALVLAALGLFTIGGSSVFVFANVIGQEHVGLSAFAVSLAFSVNAVSGIHAARFAGRRRAPGFWMAATAVCAVLVALTSSPVVFFAAMAVWGLAFWLAVPEVFSLLAERSATPEERVGDAQAIMSLGRIAGPIAGGALLATGSLPLLGLVAAATMAAGALGVEAVATAHRWRRTTSDVTTPHQRWVKASSRRTCRS